VSSIASPSSLSTVSSPSAVSFALGVLCPSSDPRNSLLANSLGTDCRPSNNDQYWVWVNKILPHSPQMHAVGLAAVCWAIWRSGNVVCFENKRIKSPTEIVCMICSFLTGRAVE
jgi:hypothetical protein